MVMYKGYSKEVKEGVDLEINLHIALSDIKTLSHPSTYVGLLDFLRHLTTVTLKGSKGYIDRRYRNKCILRGNKRAIKKLNMAIRRKYLLDRSIKKAHYH